MIHPLGSEQLLNAVNMTRSGMSPLVLSNAMYVIHTRSVSLWFWVKVLYRLRPRRNVSAMKIISLGFWVKVLCRLHPRRNVSAIKSFFVHANRTSIKTWQYSSLLPCTQLPDKYLNTPALNPVSVGRGTGLSFNLESYTALLWLTVSWTYEQHQEVWPSTITCTHEKAWRRESIEHYYPEESCQTRIWTPLPYPTQHYEIKKCFQRCIWTAQRAYRINPYAVASIKWHSGWRNWPKS